MLGAPDVAGASANRARAFSGQLSPGATCCMAGTAQFGRLEDQKKAVIRVLDASDYQKPFVAAVEDMEFTVVHELIHLGLSSLTRNFKSRSEESFSEEEKAVNRMSDALLHLDHEDQLARLQEAASARRNGGSQAANTPSNSSKSR